MVQVSPRRRRLLAWIEANPGASLQELADMLGVARTAVVYHVRCLVRAGAVRQVRQGRRLLHFRAGRRDPLHETLMGKLRQERARRLLRALHREPTMPWRRLAGELDVTPRAVRWHVQRLEEEGLIRVQEVGVRGHVVRMHPDVERFLAEDLGALRGQPAERVAFA